MAFLRFCLASLPVLMRFRHFPCFDQGLVCSGTYARGSYFRPFFLSKLQYLCVVPCVLLVGQAGGLCYQLVISSETLNALFYFGLALQNLPLFRFSVTEPSLAYVYVRRICFAHDVVSVAATLPDLRKKGMLLSHGFGVIRE